MQFVRFLFIRSVAKTATLSNWLFFFFELSLFLKVEVFIHGGPGRATTTSIDTLVNRTDSGFLPTAFIGTLVRRPTVAKNGSDVLAHRGEAGSGVNSISQ